MTFVAPSEMLQINVPSATAAGNGCRAERALR
jgi:hypothetical protein